MTDQEKQEYRQITTGLRAIAVKLRQLSDAGEADMEGAEAPEFFISEELSMLDEPAKAVMQAAVRIEEYLDGKRTTP